MHGPECRMLRAEEVAARYGISRNTVYELARQEVLPCIRIRRLVRFDVKMLEDFDAKGGFALKQDGE